ncbi:MAG: hypothetical protein LAT83_10530 [Kiritimatiellae bacterium]|nr:hypothetical protein [Kiritimatiellia bacterium]
MEFKKVKNPKRPGRAPANCDWVRDAEGNIQTNDKGEFAFRKLTAAEIAAKAKKPKAKKTAKKTAAKKTGRKAAPELGESQKAALLLKKTYRDLTSDELTKIKNIAEDLIGKAKETEIAKLEKEIEAKQAKLAKLK